MHQIFLSLGSNLGNRSLNLKKARNYLERISGRVTEASSLFETEPWGHYCENNFFNQAIRLETWQDPLVLLDSIHRIETLFGRIRPEKKFAPRKIDIDILFFDRDIYNSGDLIIPHPSLHLRRFVLEPLAEIAPMFVHPMSGATVKEMLDSCPDDKKVFRLSERGN